MKAPDNTLKRMAEKVGATTFLAWTFILGAGGFLLLCAVAYAMVTENLALGVACGVMLIVPFALGLVWILTTGTSLWEEHRTREAALREADRSPETSQQRPVLAPRQSTSPD